MRRARARGGCGAGRAAGWPPEDLAKRRGPTGGQALPGGGGSSSTTTAIGRRVLGKSSTQDAKPAFQGVLVERSGLGPKTQKRP
jgi:hypothetical protein